MTGVAHDLATRLPLTRQALHDGIIDAYKAQVIAEATRCLDAAAAATAEATIVPDRVTGKTPGQIRAEIARAVLKADPAAARQRREQAQKDARVELWREDAGTAAIVGFGLPPDQALAADQQITSRALDLEAAGVPGGMDALRVRAYLDALLGQDTAARYRTARSNSPSSNSPASDNASSTTENKNPGNKNPGNSSPANDGPSDHSTGNNGPPPAKTTATGDGSHGNHGTGDGSHGNHGTGEKKRRAYGADVKQTVTPRLRTGQRTRRTGRKRHPRQRRGAGTAQRDRAGRSFARADPPCRENQPDHPAGHPARPGRTPRAGHRVRPHRPRARPHAGRPGHRPPRHDLVHHRDRPR